jgi:rhodanese-related sulfurtransferase
MKKIVFIFPLALFLVFTTACNSQNAEKNSSKEGIAVLVENTTENVYENVAGQQFKQLIEKGDVVIVDVRTPGEFAQGHINGAKLINLYGSDFNDQIAKLNKEKTTLVYCKSGRRSGSAMRKMQSAGFKTIYNLSGGIGSWMSSGGKIVK